MAFAGVVRCVLARELSRLSGCRVPVAANTLKFRCRHREPIIRRRAEVEHQRLGHVRRLGRTVQDGAHYYASPYAVGGEVDDSGLDSAELPQALP